MHKIILINDPANITDHEIFQAKEGQSILDWMIDFYGADGPEVPYQIYKGNISKLREIDKNEYSLMNAKISDTHYIILQPQGVGTYIITAIISAIIVTALVPTPEIPNNNVRDSINSPNNSVFGQTNQARLLERVPDIFGTEKSYPDLIAPTVSEFINHEKFLTDYMVIGRGFYDIADVKTGDTPISDIPGSDVAFYDPGQTPSEVLRSQESNEVKSQILIGPNELNINAFNYQVFRDSVNDIGYILTQVFEEYDVLDPLDDVRLKDVRIIVSQIGGPDIDDLSGSYVVDDVQDWIYLTPIPFSGGISFNPGDEFKTIIRLSKIYAPKFNDFPFTTSTGWPGSSGNFFLIADIDGFNDPVTYAASLTFNPGDEQDTIMRGGIIYSPNPDRLPFTTNGNWNDDKFLFLEVENLRFRALGLSNVPSSWNNLEEPWQFINDTDAEIIPQNETVPIGPFVVPGDSVDEIWIDLQNPRGLAQGSNLNAIREVDLDFLIEEIDSNDVPTGVSFNFPISISSDTRNPRFWTFKINEFNSDIVPGNRYRVTGSRTSDSKPSSLTVLDETQWTRLAGITDITSSDDSGTTRVLLTTIATDQVASLQEKKLNMIASRKVVTWNGVNVIGNIETGEGLIASDRFADIMLHYLLDPDLAERSLSSIDVDSLYQIQNQLDLVFNGEKGEFNYTFDSTSSPAIEEMVQICQAARVILTREGTFFSFIRDQAQNLPKMLVNRRNKSPESESKTINFNKAQDNDGITFEYVDKRDYKPRTITLPNDLPADDPNFGLPATLNPKRIENIGIKNYSQAWDRAQYEFNKLIYQRVFLKSTVTYEAMFQPLNARILHVDGLRLDDTQSDGEIKSFNGNELITDNRCIFEDGKNYSVILRGEDGQLSEAIGVTQIPDNEFGFILDDSPPFDIYVRGDNNYQRGMLYSFAEDGTAETADNYLIQRKNPIDNMLVELELINYASEYYQADNQTPPPKD